MSERHQLLPILPSILLPILLPILRRVRRRRQGLAALQGAVLGGAAAVVLGAGWMVLSHWRGGKPSLAMIAAAALVLAAVSATAWALRPPSLQRCAQLLDRAGVGQDRVLSALALSRQHLVQDGTETRAVDAFVVAAIQDAIQRAGAVPLARAAPLTRPRGVGVLALGGAAVVVLGLVPWPRDDGRAQATATVKATAVPTRLARLDRDALDGERDQVHAALAAGRALGDKTLTDLATDVAATIKALTDTGMERGEALDRLAALQRQAEAAAKQAEALAQGLARAGSALNETPGTRGLGQGLTSGDPAATGKAAGELATRAQAAGQEQRAAVAAAMARAAERAGAATPAAGGAQKGGRQGQSGESGESGAQESRQRRLQDPRAAGDNSSDGSQDKEGPSERHLERLERELRDTASACRDNPAACAAKLKDGAQSLPRMQQEARSAQARRRLQSAVEQLRERLRREGDSGQAREREQQKRERQFARAARGQGKPGERAMGSPQQGEGQEGSGEETDDEGGDSLLAQGQGQGSGEGEQSAGGGDEASAQGEQGAQGSSRGSGAGESAGSDTGGDGIGSQNGGDPLGRGRDLSSTRGREQQARVQSGAGPRRSQVIEAAAARGFAHGAYRGVYRDYDAVVEESLDAGAVPPGQRYLVRRYFQLIRPRATPPPRAPQPGGK